jgi:hypothetical protein
MIRPFGIVSFIMGLAVMFSGWRSIYRTREGFVHEWDILKDCAFGNALLIVGGMLTLFGICLVIRPQRP